MASRIYTRTGDAGITRLFGGISVRKDDLRVEAYGTVDELNAALGVARAQGADAELDGVLSALQNDLFTLGSDLATPETSETQKGRVTIERVRSDRVTQLETWIDGYEAELPPLRQFILPGGSPLAAALHLARTICRRAERRCVALAQAEAEAGQPPLNPETLRYLNRLSDLLFVLARAANHRSGLPDVIWNPQP
ncbi:MAG TPA: cob(I)yrinic acid a,c-diamide adenosyltransferase [Chthonomonadaceae bacterium]|nr:cob(I)yrinic acid a,c-diamide adenosyltransferase [Chthonomonadaceae bacterium]